LGFNNTFKRTVRKHRTSRTEGVSRMALREYGGDYI